MGRGEVSTSEVEEEFKLLAYATLKQCGKSPSASFCSAICEDQFVGVISDFKAGETNFPAREKKDKWPINRQYVLMILESPHKDEFSDEGNIGPAMGKTGQKIRMHIRDVLQGDVDDLGGHGLILMNAIRHQCSLGEPTKNFRYGVFRNAWKSKACGEESFKQRLRSYLAGYEIKLIANCCTKGASRPPFLRDFVQKAIQEVVGSSPQVVRKNHPFSWHSDSCRHSSWNYCEPPK